MVCFPVFVVQLRFRVRWFGNLNSIKINLFPIYLPWQFLLVLVRLFWCFWGGWSAGYSFGSAYLRYLDLCCLPSKLTLVRKCRTDNEGSERLWGEDRAQTGCVCYWRLALNVCDKPLCIGVFNDFTADWGSFSIVCRLAIDLPRNLSSRGQIQNAHLTSHVPGVR